ncbi:MAG: sensor domain-containing diguanylate cyclase, partial [Methylococcales bacterium]
FTIYPDDQPNIVDAYSQMLETGCGEAEARAIRKDGSHFWMHVVMVKSTDDTWNHAGQSHYWFITDITERNDRELELERIALTDELTGLFNRRGFFSIATEHLERSKRLKHDSLLIFIDIDGLKVIIDRFGPADGDIAICAIARLIQETFRSSDVFARVGGDEFLVLVNDTKADEDIRAELFSRLASINSELNRPWKIAISVGYLLIPPDKLGPSKHLAEKANSAMYAVKEQKRPNKANRKRNKQAQKAIPVKISNSPDF